VRLLFLAISISLRLLFLASSPLIIGGTGGLHTKVIPGIATPILDASLLVDGFEVPLKPPAELIGELCCLSLVNVVNRDGLVIPVSFE